jgi:aryl-alcohol dehydrogenase-like predicted oxidoreductase
MQLAKFARSEREVSRLGFGAMGLCGCFEQADEGELVGSVLHSLERGVTFIDTARGYGQSEAILGKALENWRGARPFIATKVESLGPDNTRWAVPPDVSTTFPKGQVRKNAETSLRLLGVEQLDLLQLHVYWPNWGVSGYWMDELQALKEEGKVGLVGVSAPDHRHDVVLPLVLSGLIDSVQTIVNVFDPLALDSLVPLCHERGIAIIARCILDEGGLSGFLTEATTFEPSDFRKSFFESVPRNAYLERVNALRQYVPDHAGSLAALAIKFALAHPGVTTAISSMHVRRFADQNIAALEEPALQAAIFEQLRRKHRWIRNFYESKYWS